MNQERDAFTESLEMELRRRGFACDRWALSSFVRGCWPLIEEDPEPAAWAEAFRDAELQGCGA
jgi:hypothetical protein